MKNPRELIKITVFLFSAIAFDIRTAIDPLSGIVVIELIDANDSFSSQHSRNCPLI